MNGGFGRLETIAAVLIVAGLVMGARSTARVARAIRNRFTYGAPYREGMIADRVLGLLMTLPVLLLGGCLAFFAWGQSVFQPNEGGTVRVGRIEARRSGWGKVAVRFMPDPLYPARGILDGEVSGARWAIAGDFITWDRGVKWLGLRDGQRLRYLLGSRDTTGLSPGESEQRTPIEPLPGPAAGLVRLAPFIPILKVRTEASSWFPIADRAVMTVYAIGPGYLAEVVTENAPRRVP